MRAFLHYGIRGLLDEGDFLDDKQSNFATFAIDYRLLRYLKDKVAAKGPGYLQKPGLRALGHALCVRYPFRMSSYTWGDIASFLIEIGFDHTDMFDGISVWEWFFEVLNSSRRHGDEYPTQAPTWLNMDVIHPMVLLLERGACTNQYLSLSIERQHTVSLLKGARLGLQYCETETTYLPKQRQDLTTTLKRLITVLQERGAIEEELLGDVLVYLPTSQHGTDSRTEGTAEECTNTPSTLTDLGKLDAKVTTIPTETSDEICTKALDDSSSGNGAQNMTEPSPRMVANHQGPKDAEAALQVPTSFTHRRSLSLWLKRLGGRSRSARKG